MYSSDLPLVSIITPTFNQADLIEDCLYSISIQTYPNIEHIVVDGKSTDGTVKILEKWAAAPEKRFISEEDKGMYDALNKGFSLSKGEFLAYLNTDDLYFPYSIEVMVDSLRNSGADIVYGDILRHHTEGDRTNFKLLPPINRNNFGTHFFLAQPSTLWTKEIHAKMGGFDTSFPAGADTDFFLRSFLSGARFQQLEEILSIERHRPLSISADLRLTGQDKMTMRKKYRGHKNIFAKRFILEPAREIMDRFRRIVKTIRFYREVNSSEPGSWAHFINSDYLEQFSGIRLALNTLPWPLLPKKLSVGKMKWESLLPPEKADNSDNDLAG